MIRLRPATLDDLEGIRAVSVRTGLNNFDVEETCRWWLAHPFREEFAGVPMGWVLEKDGRELVGTFTNVHMMYEMDGRRYRAGIAGSWGVDVEYRNSSMMLAMSYFNQKGIDLCLNGSASSVASRVMPALKAQRIPSPDYDLSYLWITRPSAFAAAVLRKKNIPAVSLLAPVAGMALWAADSGRGGRRPAPGGTQRFTSFGTEFDGLWERLRRIPGRLRAVRTAPVLEWRFGGDMRRGRAQVFGLMRAGELAGYVVLRENFREHLQLRQFVIADLQAADEAPETVRDLLTVALNATYDAGLDALEWQGFNEARRTIALERRPRTYRYPVWPLFYKPLNPELAPLLTDAARWDFSPFDAF